jgi:hypothetical protein
VGIQWHEIALKKRKRESYSAPFIDLSLVPVSYSWG